jgi:3-methyladenine DNA glycosylase/8-oxoguanine DNA glycosylase
MKMGKNQLEVSEKLFQESLKLEFQQELIAMITEPFNFRYSLWKPSHFYTGLEAHSLTHSYRTFRLAQDVYTAIESYEQEGIIHIKIYANSFLPEDMIQSLYHQFIYSYGIQEAYTIPKWVIEKYEPTKEIIKRFYGTRISCPESLFEIAVVSLLLQNTTITRTVQMFKNLIEQYGKVVQFNNIALFSFYTPEELLLVTERELKKYCRLGYRAKYIINYAQYFTCNKSLQAEGMDKKTLLSNLQTIKGVGPYTATVITSSALRDTSAIPLDSWNRKILSKVIYQQDSIDKQNLYDMLIKDFENYAGLVSLYVIENEYKDDPVVPLLDEDNVWQLLSQKNGV